MTPAAERSRVALQLVALLLISAGLALLGAAAATLTASPV
jgi:fucose permease